MTKEQFLSGVSFRVRGLTYRGACTFSYSKSPGCICKQSRSSIDEKVVINDYECNVLKIGRLGFTAFTFVLNKKVVIKYRFEDLVIFEEEA